MSTVVQYENRTIDLLIWDGIHPSGEALLTPALATPGGGGKIVTGLQKLVQKFLKVFLQEQGTKLYAPTEGTTFVTKLRKGNLRTTFEVGQAYASALVDVKRQLAAVVTATTPEDEQLADAVLKNVILEGTTVSLLIQVATVAGTTAVFLQPLTVSPSTKYAVQQ